MDPHGPAASLDGLVAAQVTARPQALALVDAPNRAEILAGPVRRLTWSQLDTEVNRAAARLVGAGVEPRRGTPVAYQLPNTTEVVITLLACFRVGAVAIPFPIQHRQHELAGGLATSGAQVMVTAARPDRPDQLTIVTAAAEAAGQPLTVLDPSALDPTPRPPDEPVTPTPRPPDEPVTPTPRPPDEPVTVCWTSGTTGTPKGVPRSTTMWLAGRPELVAELELTADDRILCPFPVVNMAAIGGMIVPWLLCGASLHLHQPLNLPVFLDQVATEAITYTVAPPAVLNMLLLRADEVDWASLSSLKRISSGAAPLDPWMVEGWQERGIEIVNVFGSNEGAALLSTAATVPDPAQRAQCFPQPDPARVETRLVDLATGDEVTGEGQIGELRFRGPGVFTGYVGSTGEEFDDEGFFRTGDLFEWADASSTPRLMRFVDRAKDIIIRGGMNVSAAEVEALVMEAGILAECAVVAYPDPELGQRVGVVGVANPTGDAAPTLGQVVEHLRSLGVASYKLPERLELVDALPRNATGKVLKGELRRAWAG